MTQKNKPITKKQTLHTTPLYKIYKIIKPKKTSHNKKLITKE